jgi:acyl-CoA synthetase (AMP-forming)/AMP-acid ligase II
MDTTFSNNTTLLATFSKSVQLFKGKKAVSYSNDAISFTELESEGLKLAQQLNAFQTKSVLILLPLGRAYHAAIVGCMLAGCHLIPIESNDEPEALKDKIQQLHPSACLVDSSASEAIVSALSEANVRIIYVSNHQAAAQITQLPVVSDSCNLHSVFTSGSSGQLKLVTFHRESVLHHAISTSIRYQLNEAESVFQLSKPTSSLHINSFWRCLISGCTFYPNDLRLHDLTQVWQNVLLAKPEVVQGQTSVLQKLTTLNAQSPDALSTKHLIIGGEPLSQIQLKSICRKFPNLQNITYNYSSTESMLVSSITLPTSRFFALGSIPVGIPAEGKSVTIQDQAGIELPTGDSGQIVIQSKYMAKEITGLAQESDFTHDPISGLKTYRSGDLGYFDADGYLHHLGRVDRQIKINGLRIDPLLIENEILTISQINEVSVFVLKQADLNLEVLVATCVKNASVSTDDIIHTIQKRLPLSHIPKVWIDLPEIPLTERGKVDVNKLHQLAVLEINKEHHQSVDDKDATQDKIDFLTREWATVLGEAQLSPYESVFFKGADSIQMLRMVQIIKNNWNVSITPDFVIKFPTIASQASELTKQLQNTQPPEIEVLPKELKIRLGF